MAYPTIANTNNSSSAQVTGHTVSLPANISNGDLLLVFFASDGDNTCTWSDDFIEIFEMSDSGGKDAFLAIAYKYATGGEGSTITVTTTSSEKSAHASYRITGHNSSQVPEVSTGVNTPASDTPNPDSLTPTGGAKDYLWIAVEGNDDDDTVSSYPTNYSLSQINSTSADPGGCGLGVAGYNNNASSEDPGTFTLSAAEQWVACTVAVHPGASYLKTLSETLTLSDGDTYSPSRTLSETLTLTDVDSYSIKRTLSETLTFTDVDTYSQSRTLSETLSLTDSVEGIKIFSKELTETITLTGNVDGIVSKEATLSETFTLTDVDSKVWVLSREYTETLTLSDGDTYSPSRTLSETLTLTDSLTPEYFDRVTKYIDLRFTQ